MTSAGSRPARAGGARSGGRRRAAGGSPAHRAPSVSDMAWTPGDATLPRDDDERGITPGARWGRYVVLEELGSGGMGIVLAAHDPVLDRRVALKLLAHPQRRGQGAAARPIEREA